MIRIRRSLPPLAGSFGLLRPLNVRTVSPLQFYSSKSKPEEKDDVFLRIKVQPIDREGESLDKKRARLIYQSRKRGILETDLLLSRFAAKYLKHMSEKELDEYDELLDELDWDIYYWATKNFETSPLPKKWENSQLLKQLQEFSENKEREILRMPDLKNYWLNE
ncbi:hypothetical protein HG536_0G02460 [Torulaspora globosa]|uniref:Succinate dehydrogenase assembly factor 2, mitochondrial n=1 Tax=Torulaspora globosa TaxID=48254 RepID=A0A7G3ZLJ9_9SACH|nr:uncharacterized protein HG536_0G02460 [Torulaspora globosa]QLL34385.1 hypothetical protein HG536_0G02460 [Torulaspora globosa]